MKKNLIVVSALLILAGLTACNVKFGGSNTYPNRQVEMIVPYSAGGGADLTARAFSPALEDELNETTLIINKAGASGVVGFSYVASAKNDGYTIGLVPLPSVCINYVLGDLTVHPIEGYEYLGGVCKDPIAICVAANSPFNTINELVDYAKDHPEEITVAASGMTSIDTLVCLDLERVAGIKFNVVDFVGGSESAVAVMGGHADVMGGCYGEMMQYVASGQLKYLAVGEEGLGYPTFSEAGYPLTISKQVRCIIAPKGLDENVKKVLINAVKTAVNSSKCADNLKNMDLVPDYMSPEDMSEYATQVINSLEKLK